MTLAIRVWDFADRDFLTVKPNATLAEAMQLLSSSRKKSGERRQSLVVVDEKGRYVGVLSMRNILEAFKSEFNLWFGLLGKEGVEEAMTKGLKQCDYRLVQDYLTKVPALKMSDDLVKAFKILTEKNLQVRAIPVVEADKVEAVVRIPDLFEQFMAAYKRLS